MRRRKEEEEEEVEITASSSFLFLHLLRKMTVVVSINGFIALRKVSRYSQSAFFIAEIYRVASLDERFSLFHCRRQFTLSGGTNESVLKI